GSVIGAADGGNDRGGVDDGAAAVGLHHRDRIFAAKEHTAHVDCHQRVPGVFIRLHDASGDAITGVVDEDVEAPEPLYGRRDYALDVGGAGDVGGGRNRLRALACALRGDGLRVGRVLVGDYEPPALPRRPQSG